MTEPDVLSLISVDEAIRIIDSIPISLRVERVELHAAIGATLAQSVSADRDYPPFDKSVMDGFAVRTDDLSNAPVELPCVGEIPAGVMPRDPLQPCTVLAIMTGAPVPAGADAVVPVEWTTREKDRVRFTRPVLPGNAVAKRGSDCGSGSVVLAGGARIGPAQVGALACVGASSLEVYPPPRCSVLATGNELLPVDQEPLGASIRNSNSPMLVSLLERMGYPTVDRGVCIDDPKALRDAIERPPGSDVLFLTGGVSMGQYDFVPDVLKNLGYNLKITKLRIKPGKPFVFGVGAKSSPHRYVFGLPGNPVSAFACTLRLCSRLLTRLSGAAPVDWWITGALAEPLPPNGPREFYHPAVHDNGTIKPLPWKGSADLFTLARSNCLLMRPENDKAVAAGTLVRALEVPQ